MGIPSRYCTALTGGGSGALDAVSIDDVQNHEMAFVSTDTTAYLFVFKSTSTDAENSPGVIMPDDAVGPGRWHVQHFGAIGASGMDYAIFQHQEALGVSGGYRSANTWTQRPYNVTVQNDIAGCSLASGDVVLPEGTYDFRVTDQQYSPGAARIKLYNVSDFTDIHVGPSGYQFSFTVSVDIMQGRFEISKPKTIGVRVIGYYANSDGLGAKSYLDPEKEVYGILEFWRIGSAS